MGNMGNMNKNRKLILGIAATVALLVGGAGYFTASTVKDAEIKEIKSVQVHELAKVRDKNRAEKKILEDWVRYKEEVCGEYITKSEEVMEGLLTALDSSTSMIANPGDIGTMMSYTGTADGITALLPTKLIMEDKADECKKSAQ